ncbi:MAG TPA: hypothetical protein VMW10_09595 [Alphaproteobacteria bacterium]|nr:hypothetical protein [Alphaproteobacteria bacterium]
MMLKSSKTFQKLFLSYIFIFMYGVPLAHSMEEQENTEIIRQKVRKIGTDCYALNLDYNKQSLCCVYEKLSSENDIFWEWFSRIQTRWANLKTGQWGGNLKNLEFAAGCSGGATGFGNILSNRNSCEIWCAYICTHTIDNSTKSRFEGKLETDLVKSEEGYAGIDNIEMVMGVATSFDVPFYTHMGICRSLYRQHHNITPKLNNISQLLHGFATFMQDYLNPTLQKPYMVTQPLTHMRKILITTFPSHIHIGDNLNLKKQEEFIEKYKSDIAQEIVQQYEKNPSVIQIDSEDNFILLKDKNIIWKVPNGKHWFFDVADTTLASDPYVVIDRTAMSDLFMSHIDIEK